MRPETPGHRRVGRASHRARQGRCWSRRRPRPSYLGRQGCSVPRAGGCHGDRQLHERRLEVCGRPFTLGREDREGDARGPAASVSTAWEAEQQLPLLQQPCACLGNLGCLHDAPHAVGRLAPDQRDFDARFLEVGGLDLDTVVMRPQGRLVLPSVMPVIDGSEASLGVHRAMVAVLLDQTRRSGRAEASLRECLHVPPSVATLLAPFAPDDDLEALWRDRSNFLRTLLRLRPSAVTAPSYSTWDGESWLEHRYSMKRSMEFVRILQDNCGFHGFSPTDSTGFRPLIPPRIRPPVPRVFARNRSSSPAVA